MKINGAPKMLASSPLPPKAAGRTPTLSSACLALAPAATQPACSEVVTRQGMPTTPAVSTTSGATRNALTAELVLPMRHGLQMVRADAMPHPAKVVYLQAVRDRADDRFIHQPMSTAAESALAVPVLVEAVSADRSCAGPMPTAVRLHGDTGEETR